MTRSSATPRPTGSRSTSSSTGPAPIWATGPGTATRGNRCSARRGSPRRSQFGQFVRAVGTRYSGHYQGLPRVSFWSIWNEPNYGIRPCPASDQPRHDRDRRGAVPRPGRRRVERPAPDRPRRRHDPDRRDRAARARPSDRELLRRQAAAVPAGAVLRRRQLPAAARLGRERSRLPDDRLGLGPVPLPAPGPVQRERLRRPPVPGQPRRCLRTSHDGARPSRNHVVRGNDPDFADFPKIGDARADARPSQPGVRLAHAVPDLEHRVRLPDQAAGAQREDQRRNGRDLHQLGRVSVLAPAADQELHAVPARRPAGRQLRQRPRVLQRHAEGRLRRLPGAAVHAQHLRPARPPARGLGRCPRVTLSADRERSRSSSRRAHAGRSRRSRSCRSPRAATSTYARRSPAAARSGSSGAIRTGQTLHSRSQKISIH